MVAVLVNVDYWDYAKYTIDPVSLEFFKANINNIKNVLTRMIIYHDINEQVRDAQIMLSDFVPLLLSHIFEETDDKIFEFEYAFLRDSINNYVHIPARTALKTAVFEATYNSLKIKPTTNSANRIKLLKDQLSVFAVT